MDNRAHALMMSRYCPPRIAELVVRVPIDKPGDNHFQNMLISSLVHGCQMANNCQYTEAKEMQYAITERLFTEATPEPFVVQNNAHLAIVGIVSHASGMAVSGHERAVEILAAVRPITMETLPKTERELCGLRNRLDEVRQQIMTLGFDALADRRLRNSAGR